MWNQVNWQSNTFKEMSYSDSIYISGRLTISCNTAIIAVGVYTPSSAISSATDILEDLLCSVTQKCWFLVILT